MAKQTGVSAAPIVTLSVGGPPRRVVLSGLFSSSSESVPLIPTATRPRAGAQARQLRLPQPTSMNACARENLPTSWPDADAGIQSQSQQRDRRPGKRLRPRQRRLPHGVRRLRKTLATAAGSVIARRGERDERVHGGDPGTAPEFGAARFSCRVQGGAGVVWVWLCGCSWMLCSRFLSCPVGCLVDVVDWKEHPLRGCTCI